MLRALGLCVVLWCCACSKQPIGLPCSSDFACESKAEQCLHLNGADQDGVCSRRCSGPQDCGEHASCGRVSMKHLGGMMGKLSAGGTESWCVPR